MRKLTAIFTIATAATLGLALAGTARVVSR